MFDTGVSTVMLENHGVVVGRENLFEAFKSFETLDFCARLDLQAMKIGNLVPLSDHKISISKEKNRVSLDEFVAKEVGIKNSVTLIENDCCIVTGTSLLNAFDRLEVAEFSAKAIVNAVSLGKVVKIGDSEIDKIIDAFNLER